MATPHDRITDKPVLAPSRSKTTDRPRHEGEPRLPSSTTAFAEQLPEPVPAKGEADRKAGDTKLAPLQKEYDSLLEQIRDAKTDPASITQLVRRKGMVVREMDTIKRDHGIA